MLALIVDESERVAPRLEQSLTQEGYVVDVAHERGEALWLASESEADVIVVCSGRPGLHDVPVLCALRDDGETAPILVIARAGGSRDTVAALDAGADDVVVSPIPFDEVAARLRALTRRSPSLAEDDLQVGTLRLDRSAHVAIRAGGASRDEEPSEARAGSPDTTQVEASQVEVALTPREYALLELLMHKPGQLVTRTRIVDAVWGPGGDAGSNVVDQVVSHLRAKIDRPFGRRDIVTARGAGYRIVDSGAAMAPAA